MKPSKTLGALAAVAALNSLPACGEGNDPCTIYSNETDRHETPGEVISFCNANKTAAISCIELNGEDEEDTPTIHYTHCDSSSLGAVIDQTFNGDDGAAHYAYCVEGTATTDCSY